ncbi:L-aspartate--glyoxylate aminotransferase BhcA [Maritimibacter sp. HL-12]|uniref:L-aspartate--glyoxylate aminotransferase BhcA n=1 Tax=Maritimibacter sp. HL-12 TaxID=1162418 RepID=UPI000A0EFB76|nr:L-aspartate--glyoxylate aminotransferase BhcA [Maritimibacter sp. HL-12]SMH46695.1 serine-glyoxylate aminotransferase apoenzyme [Maritimibacter sp. HL-12]
MSLQNPVFIPGPTNIPEALRKACDMPTIDHRSSVFPQILQPALAGVKRVLKTEAGEAIVFPGTGTGGWEAAISNTLSPGDKVLAANFGMFSAKWIDMCRRHGLEVQVVEAPWGAALPVATFAEILAADTGHEIRAVLATHNETATGVRSDIAGLRAAMNAADHPALLFVDGVSSIASMDFRMDEWGIDVAITGSQKGFMLPAGLAIVAVSRKAVAAMERATLPRFYFDFRDMLAMNPASGYPYTPVVGLLNGLKASIEMLEAEGLDAVFARHAHIADGVRVAVGAWGLRFCAIAPDARSDTVTAIVLPDGIDGNAFVAHAETRYGTSFGAGLGAVAGKVFRIGHLGQLSETQALAGIATAEMVLADLGVDIALGSGVAAAQGVYRSAVKGHGSARAAA